MDDRLKERLTGAVLLVVLVVVLVPAMFRGERSGATGTAGAGGASAQQVYTIDLKGAAPAAPDPVPAATQPAPLPADTVASAEEPVKAAMPATAVGTPVQPAVPATATAASTPGSPVKSAPSALARSVPAGGGFAVQVGSFSKRENAAVMVRQAAKKGARLMVAGPDDRGLFRVRTAVVRTRQEAVALQEKLRAQGYKGLVGAVN